MPPKVGKRLNFLINLAYYAAVAALVYLGLKYVLGWVLPFILAFCIVSLVNPIIRLLNKRLKIKHAAASVIVMVLTYTLVGLILFELIIQVIYLLSDAFSILPAYYESDLGPVLQVTGERITSFMDGLPETFGGRLPDMSFDLGGAVQAFLISISQMGVGFVSNVTARIPSFAITFVFTIMLSFLVSVQYGNVTQFITGQFPDSVREIVDQTKRVINSTVLRYLKAVFKLMCITFAELSLGLLILRADYAIPVAAGIAVFDALPFFGTGAILVPWAAIELIQGNYTFALGLVILYAIMLVVRNIIEPQIVGKKLGLNPIVSIISIYLGFRLRGVFGMIIMPITMQILLELHKTGVIRVFRDSSGADEKKGGETGADGSE